MHKKSAHGAPDQMLLNVKTLCMIHKLSAPARHPERGKMHSFSALRMAGRGGKRKREGERVEEEQLQPTPEQEQNNETTLSPENPESGESAENENAGITPTPESPENTGFSENENDENREDLSSENDAESGAENENQQDQEPGTEEDGDGNTTNNITIIRPPAQITYNTSVDTEATYHVTVENETGSPVPVLVTETLVEDPPGIMEKKLEDYTVTEALLLLILITLWLRIIFDYFGRRRT